MATWTSEGLPPDLFWRVTPRVFTAIMEGRHQASIEREKSFLALAWHIEAFARKRRLPKLEKLLRQLDRQKLPEQTPDDMLAALRAIDGGQGLMSFKFIPHEAGTEG